MSPYTNVNQTILSAHFLNTFPDAVRWDTAYSSPLFNAHCLISENIIKLLNRVKYHTWLILSSHTLVIIFSSMDHWVR